MKSNITHRLFAGLLILSGIALHAQTTEAPKARGSYSFDAEGDTTGFGPVLSYTASPNFNFTLSHSAFSYDADDVKGSRSARLDFIFGSRSSLELTQPAPDSVRATLLIPASEAPMHHSTCNRPARIPPFAISPPTRTVRSA